MGFGTLTGRHYRLYDYYGCADAERVIVMMGSGCETAEETIDTLTAAGERVGLLKVRLYRTFAAERFCAALPASTRAIAVLDRCKEPGAAGEPLYLDVVASLAEHWPTPPRVVGGRYGLSSKDFTPAMVKAVFDNLRGPAPALNHFAVGIDDDVAHRSLSFDADFVTEAEPELRAIVYGLGSDGTVGANKSTIKTIGESTDLHVQAYFVYDSKKAGSVTVSHLRFGPRPIRSTYLIQRPTLVACHQGDFVGRFDLLAGLVNGGTLLLNCPYPPASVASTLAADRGASEWLPTNLPIYFGHTSLQRHLEIPVIQKALFMLIRQQTPTAKQINSTFLGWLLLFMGLTTNTMADSPQRSYYLIGNSLTWDTVPNRLDGDVQWHIDCGVSLTYIRTNPEKPCVKESTIWPKALRDKQYDYVSVQPHYERKLTEEVQAISTWMKMQPKAIFVIHSGWAPQVLQSSEPTSVSAPNQMTQISAYMRAVVAELNRLHPGREIRQTFAQNLLALVAEDVETARAPLKSIAQLYRDRNHMIEDHGKYLMHNAMRRALDQPVSANGFDNLKSEIKQYLDRLPSRLTARE